VSEEHRNYGVEPDPERSRPEGEGSEQDPSRLGRIHTNPTTTTMSPKDENNWSILAHLTVFLNLVTGFLGPVAALVIWLVYRDRSSRVSFHALQSLWYQVAWMVILAVGWTVAGILTVVLIGFLLFPVMIVATIVPFVHMGYAAYKVSQGEDYRYPFVADLIDRNRPSNTV
jgi:uncharacterized Tic20 family protein